MRLVRLFILCSLAVLLFAGSAFAQVHTSLEIRGDVNKPRSWTVDDVKKQFAGEIQTVTKTGRDKKESTLTGIPLISLLRAADLKLEETPKHYDYSFFVIVQANDGYRGYFTIAELTLDVKDSPTLLVWEENGKPLADVEQPFRLFTRGTSRSMHGIMHITLVDGNKLAARLEQRRPVRAAVEGNKQAALSEQGKSDGAFAQDDEYLKSLIERFRFYNMSHGIFAPVYPALAKQLVEDYGKTKGIAVDLGGADGSLAFALAKISELTVYNVDINPGATRICNVLTDRHQLTGRVLAIEGDATNLPLRDNFADLVVSRNSMIFWPDMALGVREAYRILKPGGVAFMGVGSPRTLDKETLQKLSDRAKENGRKMAPIPKDLPKQLSVFGIKQVRIIEGPDGSWWVEMRKPANAK